MTSYVNTCFFLTSEYMVTCNFSLNSRSRKKKQLINEITEQIIRITRATSLSLKSDLEGPDTVSSFAKEMPRR